LTASTTGAIARCVVVSAAAVIASLALAPRLRAAAFPPDSAVRAILTTRVDAGQANSIVVGLLEGGATRVIAYGAPDPARRPPDARTVFEIGSVTKVFTTSLLADMARRGEVRLDQPVAELLPKGVRVPAQDGRAITLLDLATQRSGLPRVPDNMPTGGDNPYAAYTVDSLYAFLTRYTLPRAPGARYEYSNLGMGLLGHALARRAGRTYEAILVERVLGPLGLRDTRITLDADLRQRLTPGHDLAGKVVPNWDLPALAGAGALRSTASDMLRFVAANLDSTGTPVSAALWETHRRRNDTTIPGTDIGLAWHIIHRPQGDLLMHNGGTGGYHAFVAFDPARRVGVVVLANSVANVDDIGFHLMDSTVSLTTVTKHDEVKVDPALLGEYVGRYALTPAFVIEVSREADLLFIQATNQPKLPVFAESDTRFFLRAVEAQISFERDSTGKVATLVLHQNGRDQRGARLP
jgi:D-alanyl-D-alanine-carboxypeptidase/D-alanyl-D-alanine-endopeptidase